MQMAKLFQGRDIPFEVIVSDASAYVSPLRIRSPNVTRIRSPLNRSLDWKGFYPLHVVYNFLNNLEKTFPSTCTVSVIGRSVEGRDIKMLKISNSDANNTGVWLDGATHAREWISTSVVTYIADYLAKNFDSLSVNYTSKDWYYWGRGGTDHSSGDPNHLNYRGPEPFSEPETTAIKDMILYSGTPFKIFLSFHACSEAISFPWCHTADPCPDYVNLLEGGTAMAKAIFETAGRMYKVGNFKDIMYYASGTSIDWSYGTARIPFSYLVELRSKQDRFTLRREEIIVCCKEILNGVKALVEFADKKKCLNCSVIPKKLRN
ncbi:hypothetical protein HW555_004408 [Spodoptera exigua]|uniref:Peptidase M14 domain-containing protein n=1 Tax=Spodoptera exigua TaxID=7107 RepID=A0A835GKB1_SPOEX|nr:hypothetical protein HW555_004408 [Spodoptera exigua]